MEEFRSETADLDYAGLSEKFLVSTCETEEATSLAIYVNWLNQLEPRGQRVALINQTWLTLRPPLLYYWKDSKIFLQN